MAAEKRTFLVVQARAMFGGTPFNDEQLAREHAARMVGDDKSPRCVIEVVAEYQANPNPQVMVTDYRPNTEQEQPA